MALNFPDSPTLNQKYPQPAVVGQPVYTWDGEKWTTYTLPLSALVPSDTNPVMDGTAAPGIAPEYSRGDHQHPTDTTRAPLDSPALTGTPSAPTPAAADNSTKIATTAFVKTNVPTGFLPLTGGTLTGPLTATTYTAGTGTVISNISIELGIPGSSGPAYIDFHSGGSVTDYDARIIQTSNGTLTFYGPSFTFSGSATINGATTINGALTCAGGDLRSYRAGGTTGVLYLSTSGSYYLYWDGSNYTLASAHLFTAAGRVLGTTTDAGIVQNGRLAFAADFSHSTTFQEPYAGAVCTGGAVGYSAWSARYRWMQLQNYNGTWYTVGTA